MPKRTSLTALLITLICIFASGCIFQDDASAADTEYEDALYAGKDLDISGTVTNIGTFSDPEYEVRVRVTNEGESEVSYDMAYSHFLIEDEAAQLAAERQGLKTIERPDVNPKVLAPKASTTYIFSSGPDTAAWARLGGGSLSYDIALIRSVSGQNKAEFIALSISDLPAIIGGGDNRTLLLPQETKEIEFEQILV